MADNKFDSIHGDVEVIDANEVNQANGHIIKANTVVINSSPQVTSQPKEQPTLPPETRVALINRTKQWNEHIMQRIKAERQRKNFAFVVAGVKEEWPESLKHRLVLHLDPVKLSPLSLDSTFGKANDWKHDFQLQLLKYFLQDIEDESDFNVLQQQLISQLSQSNTPLFFYCLLRPDVSKNQNYIQTIISYWESLDLTHSQNQHVLLIVYGIKEKGFLSFGSRQVEKWRKALLEKLCKNQNTNIVLPSLKSPSREEVNYWISDNLKDKERIDFDEAFGKIRGKRVPHLKLMETYIKIAHKSR